MVFSTRALVASGVAAGVGGCVGGLFSNGELVKRQDSLNIKIAKIAAGALLGAIVTGTCVLGVVTIISTQGLLFGTLLIALAAIKGLNG